MRQDDAASLLNSKVVHDDRFDHAAVLTLNLIVDFNFYLRRYILDSYKGSTTQ